MGDDKRRDPRPFEPPPWERERFEEFTRKREAEEARCREDAAARAAEPDNPELSETEAFVAAKRFDHVLGKRACETHVSETVGMDHAKADAMLLQLAHEDPTTSKRWWLVGMWVGVVMAVFGAVLTVWGAVQAVRTRGGGNVTAFGSLTVLVFGLAFIGLAVWLIVRSNGRRGEL